MQVPIRKKETYVKPKPDPYLTEEKFQELQRKLESLKKRHPGLSAEVKRLAEMGDFSENAGYQLAKGRLRALNQRILELEVQLRERSSSVLIAERYRQPGASRHGYK
jgi:predicted RNase H-like nuclease (RuvC/YqgF family)